MYSYIIEKKGEEYRYYRRFNFLKQQQILFCNRPIILYFSTQYRQKGNNNQCDRIDWTLVV